MSSLWLLSCFCLVLTAAICIVGVFSSHFDDTLLQRLGMAILCFFCAGRAGTIWMARDVNPDWFGVHLGMAVFAVGTALKIYALCAKERRERYLERRHIPERRRAY